MNDIKIHQATQYVQLISREQIVQIAQALAGHVDLPAAVAAISNEINDVIPHNHFDVALFSENRDELIVYETGIQTSWGLKRRQVANSPIQDLLLGMVNHMVFEDASHDKRVNFEGSDNQPILDFNLRSRVHVRVEIGGSIIGALSLSSQRAASYAEPHVQAAQIVANVVGPYFYALRSAEIAQHERLEHAKELALRKGAESLTQSMEKERIRIGMDLHDQVLADLSRLALKLENTNLSDVEKINETKETLTTAIQDVRNIVEDAKPTLLEFFGLGTAIESFLAQATRNIMIEGRLTFDPPELDKIFATVPYKQLTLYRIVQEAVNNAVRHADATEIEISYLRQQRKSEIKIKDNGCGFTLGKSKPLGGMQNMKARGKLMGAQVQFDSSNSNTGTCITITFSDTVEDC